MNAVDNLFADMMKMPSIFGSNMLDRIFSTEPKELEEVSFFFVEYFISGLKIERRKNLRNK